MMNKNFHFFTLLLCLSLAYSQALIASTNKATPITNFLMEDGTLAIPKDFSGSLDTKGFSITLDECEGPIALPVTSTWSALGSGLSSECYAIAVTANGDLYAGGNFTQAGGQAANYIAKWDGATWSTLGNGLNSTCFALAIASNGDLYAGGDFTQAGGQTANFIAKWDGVNWSPLGTGLDDWCLALAITPNGDLYAGGTFLQAGGQSANYIAKWDGANWSTLGTGLDGNCNDLAIAPNGDLYAGGGFNHAGGQPANRIAKWDGANWSTLGTGLNSNCLVLAIASNGDLYAGGVFTQAGGQPANYIAKWDGANWMPLGTGLNSTPEALAIASNGDLYAGGVFTEAGGQPANYIAKWDGTNWSPLGNGLNERCKALAVVSNGDLYAGGEFTQAGGQSANFIAKYGSAPPCDIMITNVASTPETCIGGMDGSITINATCTSCTAISYSINGAAGPFQTSSTFNNLAAGTSFTPYVKDSGASSCNATATNVSLAAGPLPCGWSSGSGNNGIGGCAGVTPAFNGGVFNVATTNCAPSSPFSGDKMAFVSTQLCGDGEIKALVTNINGNGFAGVMMRASNDPLAPKMAIGTNRVNRIRREVRTIQGYPSFPQAISANNRFWVRITRTGSQFRADASPNGTNWFPYAAQNIQMGNCVLVGMYTYGTKPNNPVTASLSNVFVTGLTNPLAGTDNPVFALSTPGDNSSSIIVFPNPTTGVINLNLSNFIGKPADIQIYNALGQEMLRQELEEVQLDVLRLDASHFEQGMYNVVIKVSGQTITKRIIINRP